MTGKAYPYDPDLPYVVEGAVSEALYARFTGRDLAEQYVENTGGLLRVIDTTPAPRVPEDAEFITWTGGGLRYTAFRNVHDIWNYAPAKAAPLEDLPGVTPDTVFTVLEERKP